mgnify:CR=1 FL=1
MSDMEFYESGFDEFSKMLEAMDFENEQVLDAMEKGAGEFVSDIRKLPRPRSKMSAPGYAHLLDTITYQRSKKEIEVGWGKYYGPMVEYGTTRMNSTPHIKPTFEKNKEKYYKIITQNIFRR